MLLLVEKFAKLCSKPENICHNNDVSSSSSLHDFKSHVSKFIFQLALDSEEILSLSWTGRCFTFLTMINKAFTKLVMDIDYPMSKWEVGSIELYLNYTLCLMKLLNSISSSLSHLGHARLSLAHGLSTLLEQKSLSSKTKHMESIQPRSFRTEFGKEFYKEINGGKDKEEIIFSGKDCVVHEAMKEMKMIGFWVCGVLLSGLHSDAKPYTQLRNIIAGGGYDYSSSSIFKLDVRISEGLLVEKVPIFFNEVKELKIAVLDRVVVGSDDEAKKVKTKLHDFGTILDGINKEVDDLFACVMAQRSELIDCFRLKKQHRQN